MPQSSKVLIPGARSKSKRSKELFFFLTMNKVTAPQDAHRRLVLQVYLGSMSHRSMTRDNTKNQGLILRVYLTIKQTITKSRSSYFLRSVSVAQRAKC